MQKMNMALECLHKHSVSLQAPFLWSRYTYSENFTLCYFETRKFNAKLLPCLLFQHRVFQRQSICSHIIFSTIKFWDSLVYPSEGHFAGGLFVTGRFGGKHFSGWNFVSGHFVAGHFNACEFTPVILVSVIQMSAFSTVY